MWGLLGCLPYSKFGSAIASACQPKLPNSTVISAALMALRQTNHLVCSLCAASAASKLRKIRLALFHKRRYRFARGWLVQHFGKNQRLVTND